MSQSLESRTVEEQVRILRRWQETAPLLFEHALRERGYNTLQELGNAPYHLWSKKLDNEKRVILYQDITWSFFNYIETKPGISVSTVVNVIEKVVPEENKTGRLRTAGYLALPVSAGIILGHMLQYTDMCEALQAFNPAIHWSTNPGIQLATTMCAGMTTLLPTFLCWLAAEKLKLTYIQEARRDRCQDIADVYIIDSQYALERALAV